MLSRIVLFSLILCGFLLLTMFVVFSFSCSDDVLIDKNVQAFILFFSLIDKSICAIIEEGRF